MSKNTTTEAFATINPEQLSNVAGGASRSSSSGNSELTARLTQISSSIKDLASANNSNSGGDTMQMMLMMMMMGGGGGGGAVAAAPAAVATPPVINVDTSVLGGGCRRGKKGW